MSRLNLVHGVHECTIDGVRQRYHVAGQGPVCLVHPGGPGGHWEYLRMPLLENHMTAVYVAAVGAGESGDLPDGEYSMERFAHFVDALVEHLDVPDVYFLGHSAGAFAGLQYALLRPGRLAGLLLYSGAPVYGPDLYTEAAAQMRLFAERYAGHPGVADVMDAFESQTPRTSKAELMDHMGRLLPAYFAEFWSRQHEFQEWLPTVDIEYAPAAYPADWDVRESLGEVGVPTQILAGRYDFICPVRWAEEMHKGIPASRLAIFENSGHFAHVEERERFAQTVREFLRG
ncbi:alpha/beta fold hydrolase [Nonomuraea aridisoli]|uniref:alpha/beta fold hydrolase n=1 Tax=Nonomuraea aridisoli TaxID=2070368 RepID=UPI001C647424|nr:alpha/beta hydrolase [Nonomuraea aridisoli]